MKAIILSAGMGSRLSLHTQNKPKGMIEFAGKSLLKHQIDTFRSNGIKDISIVRGYKLEKINFDGVNYFDNFNFQTTNMVESLLCAKDKLIGNCIVTYSDLLLQDSIVKKLINSKYDIGVVVDENFEKYWKERLGNEYLEDMESLKIKNSKIVSLGDTNAQFEEVSGRYVGAIKFSGKGIQYLREICSSSKSKNLLNMLGNRKFKNWHMTDLLNTIIVSGFIVNPILISRGWLEFDTDKDFELYNEWYKQNTLSRFIEL